MFLGFIFAVSACLIWGLVFVVPQFLSDFSTMEVALGRYFSYGVLSTILFFRRGKNVFKRYPLKVWGTALTFGLACNILYYMGVVAGLRFASAPITVLIVGMAPVIIAFYGNWHAHEVSYKSLILPCVWITVGMILVNVKEVDWTFAESSFKEYLMGMVGIFGALLSWSWFAVQNALFLKRNTQIPSSEWSTIIGVSTFFWVILLALFFAVGPKEIEFSKFMHLSKETIRYLAGIGILGIICSWLGCFCWNRASTYLPFSLMGPLLILETIFSLILVFIVEKRTPSWLELLGVGFMLGGIGLSAYLFKRRKVSV